MTAATLAMVDARRPVRLRLLGRVEYTAALRLQEAVLQRLIASPAALGEVLVVEHDPVYTLGRGADEADLGDAPRRLGVPVHRVGRGGGATFHGPGQVVAYPVVRLSGGSRDVHAYIRRLEAALVATCERFGVAAGVRPGATGVWTPGGKIGAIGIGVRRGVAYHGVALNVSNSIEYFAAIVPCRAPGMAVTTLVRQAADAAVDTVAGVLAGELCRHLELRPLATVEDGE